MRQSCSDVQFRIKNSTGTQKATGLMLTHGTETEQAGRTAETVTKEQSHKKARIIYCQRWF